MSPLSCIRCRTTTLVFPLHGVDKGGPLVCPKCAGEVEKMYSYERGVWLARLGLKEKPRPRGPGFLTLELLEDILRLVHPDKHPAERAELATRVTADLIELKPFTPPAPPPPPPVTVKPPSHHGTDRKSLHDADKPIPKPESMICVDCIGYPPMYYCASCRAREDERRRKERERENEKARKRRARRSHLRLLRQPPSSCAACGEAFKPARKDARFCSTRCRVASHRREHREATPA